ncbi:MAG: hybrid sensor histidine kinase/response regulator [Epsilonproteobacteria bacterium]|nr:MAG: hybrid sensor histidine kinase/response regulator [Campylobacterota bacterium]
MFQNIKVFVLTLGMSLAIGLISFFQFHLGLWISVGLSSLTMIAFFLFFRTPAKEDVVEDEEVETIVEDDNNVKYRLLEKKFKAISKKAEGLEVEKKTTELFLASMSHEIRTPLNGIIGLTDILDGTLLDEEQKEFVSMIRESSNNLRVIVNDVLDVSKMNAGKMELESIPFDLFKKIQSSIGVFKPALNEKDIALTFSTNPKMPHNVMGDPTRLSQVLINLVSNALKFTESGGNIVVGTEYIREEKGSVTFTISVKDSGIGLTQNQQKKIFEPYSQAEASTSRKSGGTGLGLTISSKIISSMGGKIQVKSEEGEGATFFFTLTFKLQKEENRNKSLRQIKKSKVTKVKDKVENKNADAVEKKSSDSLSVLVAEDNMINQKLIKVVLENMGLKVTLASDGEQAYKAYEANKYDMVFMDIQMPVMGGVESTHKILAYEKEQGLAHVPIIALTANALPGDKEKYIAEGMDDYATKPLDVKVLEKLIKKYGTL